MNIINIILFGSYLLTAATQNISSDTTFKNHCLNIEEKKLYLLINDYRKDKKLPPIPLSKSLSYVAHKHMVDLYENVKTMTHGWSTCDYNSNNNKTYPCMWLKPSEMTQYKAYGYECVFQISFGNATALDAITAWKKSTAHNNVIINKGIWLNSKWNALGVGIYKNYAAIWFGEDKDLEEEPLMCIEENVK